MKHFHSYSSSTVFSISLPIIPANQQSSWTLETLRRWYVDCVALHDRSKSNNSCMRVTQNKKQWDPYNMQVIIFVTHSQQRWVDTTTMKMFSSTINQTAAYWLHLFSNLLTSHTTLYPRSLVNSTFGSHAQWISWNLQYNFHSSIASRSQTIAICSRWTNQNHWFQCPICRIYICTNDIGLLYEARCRVRGLSCLIARTQIWRVSASDACRRTATKRLFLNSMRGIEHSQSTSRSDFHYSINLPYSTRKWRMSKSVTWYGARTEAQCF